MTEQFITEYRIVEKTNKSQRRPTYTPHGGYFANEQDALDRLQEMRDTYEKYGRRFRLQTRIVSSWTATDD